ncbi:MAG: FAD-dependent oxidoreductase, partial [bacterium]
MKRLLIIVLVLVAVSFLLWRLSDYYKLPFVTESPRNIPIAYQVDVVVVGGSTGAVTAAATAARAGAKVFLAAPNSYLGEDMAATCRLWREKKEPATDLLAEQVFAPGSPATPLQVKRTLDA